MVAGLGRQPAPCQDTGGVVALRLKAPQARAAALDVAWCSPSMRDPGAPSVSGMEADGGVVWVLDTGDDAGCYALDARTGAPVYRSGGADTVGRAQPTVTPAVVGGRVFVGAGDRIEAFGLRRRSIASQPVRTERRTKSLVPYCDRGIGVGSDLSGIEIAQALLNHAV